MANTIAMEEENAKSSDAVTQVCCRRGASDPETGQTASIRACVDSTGDAVIDLGAACSKAQTAANAALKVLLAP
ncbi:hypothetical protein [Flavobacterium sp.]|uniref:hypothetical protein n=1 Tax=Flavobacterium sp. TaxID=239 RepID=UPI003751BF26